MLIDVQPPDPASLIETTEEFDEQLNDLDEVDYVIVCDSIMAVFTDVMEYFAAMLVGRLPEYLAESPAWAQVGTALTRGDATELMAQLPGFALHFRVDRARGRIVLHGLVRRGFC